MLTNEQMQQEFALFGDIWKMFKCLLPVGDRTDESYWDEAVRQVTAIRNKYPGQLSNDLALVILDELERRMKENES